MSAKKLNVLVYTGTGTTTESVRHCIWSLRRLLSPNYAVTPITESILLKEPWAPTCALLVFPGGGDLGYCRVFNGEGNRRIGEFVKRGGSYLGFCAGGYYGTRRCEFEVDNKPLEVIGNRELGFFPGACRGGAFKGFEYHSEGGARAAKLKVATHLLDGEVAEDIVSYYNGGGVFVDAASIKDRKVEVLASYDEELDVDGGDGKAAVVFCQVGAGKALLTGPHPEFAAANLNPQPNLPDYAKLIEVLASGDKARAEFLKACLRKLDLEIGETESDAPSPSCLHLSSINNSEVDEQLAALSDIIEKKNGEEWIKCETDTFKIQNEETVWEVDALRQSLLDGQEDITNYNAIVKKIVPHTKAPPDSKLTPQFNHKIFFSSLRHYQTIEPKAETWGNLLLYGEVVNSTNTLLEKNPKLISNLPTGFTLTASTQLAGRGRGSNVWVSPPGCLIFSTLINHPAHLAVSHPIVFIQYIACIAIVEAIKSYDKGYEDLPVKIKWPNDIYARDPSSTADDPTYVKICGMLSQCTYSNGAYQVILGIGINTVNPRPTMSISDLLPPNVPPLRLETLLARVLTKLEVIHAQFMREGFSSNLEARYYRHWLHTGQNVTLEAEGGTRARVLGITRDWGMLKVEETDREGRGTGKIWSLQSDENSFDYWKGLVRRKT